MWGPLYRSILDKLWVDTGGINLVGQWAQLQTLIDFIGAPIGSGIGIGVSIIVAQKKSSDHKVILLSGYCMSLAVILPFLLVAIIYSQLICQWLGLDPTFNEEVVISLIVGYLNIGNILLCNFLIGSNQQVRAFYIICFTTIPNILLLRYSPFISTDISTRLVLYCYATTCLITSSWMIFLLCKTTWHNSNNFHKMIAYSQKLVKFIFVGFAIGVLSPLCLLMVRSFISIQQDWAASGVATGLWRASDWIFAPATTMVFYHYLPILSLQSSRGRALESIKEIALKIVPMSFIALLLLVILREPILNTLYGDSFIAPLEICLYFWIGDAFRILSSVFLMGLYVLKATKLIAIWDLFSQPLFSLLLFMGMASSLRLTGVAFASTYLIYALLCIFGFLYIEKNRTRTKK